ncbi:type II secretion system protein [Wenzhouxiangella sp. AB-CW3]|uniref:type II secretion system protein n=1 Tax=Wenzhouxiangella sp. AB-CW3 TaxID=2771012 RepID=UPI00168A4D43|nr:type II secretion system protein [Wenzhouxiangella sp. AB-CW3]QOC22183.1 type II secretion system protein [Wenzhouxiangella sp. AB-CW3]
MKKVNRFNGRQSGFTLVEMAVVLAVIGLILGAVMIGLDIQRNAEYTKVKQKFIDQWVVAYNAYYQRTGVPVGDSQIQPQLMVNGERFVDSGNSSGGDMSDIEPLEVICEGDNPALDGLANVDADRSLRTLMLQAGVTLPPGRGEGFEDRYVYLDSNGNPQEIQVCFGWNPPDTPSGSGNVMVITGLTPDLARYLDQAIDGQADAREGMFRQVGLNGDGDRNQPGLQWNTDNTYGIGDEAGEPGAGPALNEAQVITVAAHYKMNQ